MPHDLLQVVSTNCHHTAATRDNRTTVSLKTG
ncbi:MAG: hypothetical protein ACI9S7_001400, partial [Candidatus Paceibacteria bacterium]